MAKYCQNPNGLVSLYQRQSTRARPTGLAKFLYLIRQIAEKFGISTGMNMHDLNCWQQCAEKRKVEEQS